MEPAKSRVQRHDFGKSARSSIPSKGCGRQLRQGDKPADSHRRLLLGRRSGGTCPKYQPQKKLARFHIQRLRKFKQRTISFRAKQPARSSGNSGSRQFPKSPGSLRRRSFGFHKRTAKEKACRKIKKGERRIFHSIHFGGKRLQRSLFQSEYRHSNPFGFRKRHFPGFQ